MIFVFLIYISQLLQVLPDLYLYIYIYIYRHRPYLGLVVFTAHEIPEVWRAFFSQPTRVKRTEIALD